MLGVSMHDVLAPSGGNGESHPIVDRIVPERPDAADEPEESCRRVGQVLREELSILQRQDREDRLRDRLERYRRLGLA